jgi:hypothetical protein
VLCHGPVRVPADAAAGKAILRVELPQDSKYPSIPTDLTVELTVKGKAR